MRDPLRSLLLVLIAISGQIRPNGACLCKVLPNYQCPEPPRCCDSGYYTLDTCGCCLTCAKSELQQCGGPNDVQGICGEGLGCLKTCRESFSHLENLK